MVGLGLVVTWAGYLVLNLGWYMVKGIPLSVSDLALPSRAANTRGIIKSFVPVANPSAAQLQQQGLGAPPAITSTGPMAGSIAGGGTNSLTPAPGNPLGYFFNPAAGQ